MDARALTELRSLAARDSQLLARSGELGDLDAAIAVVRARAESIATFLASYPEQLERRASDVADAEADIERRAREVADAEAEVASARDDEAAVRARLRLVRAQDHIAVATTKLERMRALRDELERDAAARPAELAALADKAAALTTALEVSPPAAEASALVEWGSHAHAEVFVAASQVDTQRERLIREANELASMLLGEATYGSTPTQALARVEAA